MRRESDQTLVVVLEVTRVAVKHGQLNAGQHDSDKSVNVVLRYMVRLGDLFEPDVLLVTFPDRNLIIILKLMNDCKHY